MTGSDSDQPQANESGAAPRDAQAWHQRVRQESGARSHTRLFLILGAATLAMAVFVGYMATTGYMSQKTATEAPPPWSPPAQSKAVDAGAAGDGTMAGESR